MFFWKKRVRKAPLFDRLTATTMERVASYVEAHKDSDDLVETAAFLLAMASAGHLLPRLPPLLPQADRDVLAFEALVFSFYLLKVSFEALDPFEENGEMFGNALQMVTLVAKREAGWNIKDVLEKRLMQYAGAYAIPTVIEKFYEVVLSIGAATHPAAQYPDDSRLDLALVPLAVNVMPFVTTIPEGCAKTLENIIILAAEQREASC